MVTRTVVLLCGPPGAGKSTVARESGLDVFDRDDARWSGEADFRDALRSLARTRDARAVVIRTGASSTSRRAAAELVAATHMYVLTGDPRVLADRVRARGRADLPYTIAGITRWFDRFDADDGVQLFPGWATVLAPPSIGVTSGW